MTTKKNAYHHGNLRTELLNAAMEILDESAVEAVTIRQVARKVGVAHSAPANHFPDKKSMLTTLAVEIFISLSSVIKNELDIAPNDLTRAGYAAKAKLISRRSSSLRGHQNAGKTRIENR